MDLKTSPPKNEVENVCEYLKMRKDPLRIKQKVKPEFLHPIT